MPATERQELRYSSLNSEEMLTGLNVPAGWGEEGYTLFECTTIRPALTVNGLIGGYFGPGNKVIIPRNAAARLSFRLVPSQDPKEIAGLLYDYIDMVTPQAVHIDLKIMGSSLPVLIPRKHPVFSVASRAVYKVWGVPPIFTRSGGSISFVSQLQRRFKVPIVLLGFGLPEDNIHAPNEKISLPNFFRGVETVIQLLEECRR